MSTFLIFSLRQCCRGKIKGYGYECPDSNGVGAFEDNIGKRKKRDMNMDMNNNYDPNPALLSMNDDNQDFETDYDMQDYFSSYNY